MIVYQERYGDTIDGYGGKMITEYELEPSDKPYIIEQIKYQLEDLPEDYDIPSSITITLICPHSEEEIEFEIDPKDYL